jgi:hypothetical protein
MAPSSTSLRVALAQTCPSSAQAGEAPQRGSTFRVLEHNLAECQVQVEKAAKEGADVVVFPEYFLQGLLDEGRQVGLRSTRIADSSILPIPLTTSSTASPAWLSSTRSLLSVPLFFPSFKNTTSFQVPRRSMIRMESERRVQNGRLSSKNIRGRTTILNCKTRLST